MNALRRAQWLDRELGDPCDPPGALSNPERVEELPADRPTSGALRTVLPIELHPYYVPRALGGEFCSFEEVGALMRVVARRDMSTALTQAFSLLGAVVVWLAGNPCQRRALAAMVLRGERISVALSEPESGSDLLAMSTTAQPSGGGYHLLGDKSLDADFDQLRFVVVYARTSDRGGPRGFSLFLIDKQAIPGGVHATRQADSPGLRGTDLTELHFDTPLPGSALIGGEGSGFEVILKALQVSRMMCGALSLGALDTSLETVLRFALQHEIHGALVADLPQSQKQLCEAWAELLIGDSLTGLALRGIHAVSSQSSVHSSVVKYLVPTLTEQAMQKLSVVYATRHHIPRSGDPGVFQKMYRDNMVVSLFDGGAQISLFSLSHQLRSLIVHFQPTDVQPWAHYANPPDELDWTQLSVSAGGEDAVLAGFDAGSHALQSWLEQHGGNETSQSLEASLGSLARSKDDLFAAVRRLSAGAFAAGHPEGFELARRYCVVEATAAVLTDWRLNRAAMTTTLADPAVLAVVLHRLTAQLGGVLLLPPPCYRDCFAALLARRERDGRCSLYVMPTEGPDPLS